MRIIHTGDLHLDTLSDSCIPDEASFQAASSPQRWRTFQRLISYANDCEADLLLICGDLFHRQPDETQLREANELFSSLTHTQAVIIAGNHDFLFKDSPMRSYSWAEQITVLPCEPDSQVCFPSLNTVIHGFSYPSCQMTNSLWDDFSAPKDTYHHILMLHGGDSDHLPLNFSSLERSGFDYIALGHIHKPLIFPGKNMAYCGSLEPLDHTETGNHGFMQIDFHRRDIDISFIPFSYNRFISLSFQITPEDTLFSLRRTLAERMRQGNPGDLYSVHFSGEKDPSLNLSIDSFSDLAQLYEISDSTSPWYDFQSLIRQHGSNLIGQYIRTFLPEKTSVKDLDEIHQTALYTGLKALLESAR